MIGDRYKQLAVTASRHASKTSPASEVLERKDRRISITPRFYADVETGKPIDYAEKVSIIAGPPIVIYKPRYDATKWIGKDYTVMNNSLYHRKPCRVSGFKELCALSKTRPEIKWLLKFTNVDETIFDIAKQNPFVPIYGQIKYITYMDYIKAELERRGEDPTEHSILTFKNDIEAVTTIYTNAMSMKKEHYWSIKDDNI